MKIDLIENQLCVCIQGCSQSYLFYPIDDQLVSKYNLAKGYLTLNWQTKSLIRKVQMGKVYYLEQNWFLNF